MHFIFSRCLSQQYHLHGFWFSLNGSVDSCSTRLVRAAALLSWQLYHLLQDKGDNEEGGTSTVPLKEKRTLS